MKRRFNYTGRKKIPKGNISIKVDRTDPGELTFDAKFDWSGLELPDNSFVYVEAYHQTTYMRFGYGRVSNLQIPDNRLLKELEYTDNIHFRVKVVTPDGSGKLLAVADRISPVKPEEDTGKRQGSLGVELVDLGQKIWNFDGDNPVLEVNSKIDNIKNIASSNGIFISLVYPAVIRQILTKILLLDDYDPDDDSDSWKSKWIHYSEKRSGNKLPENNMEIEYEEWIDKVEDEFCNSFKILYKFINQPGRN